MPIIMAQWNIWNLLSTWSEKISLSKYLACVKCRNSFAEYS